MSDFDSPWKEALDRFLPFFLAFFFPKVNAIVDWTCGYESLDTELQQVAREGELGLRLADKLFRVWRLDGKEAWILIHVEVQSQTDEEFAERMYIYNYRLYDRFRRPIVSLAVLGDDRADWRPSEFGYELGGCIVRFEFPVIKLLDYHRDLPALENESNPFGVVVLAHLQALATRRDAEMRKQWKTRLVKGLFNRGLDAEAIRQLFRLVDWMMDLPNELAISFNNEIRQYEEEKKMPYVTSIERIAREEGRKEGRDAGREEGRHEGREEGREKGREEGRHEGREEGRHEGEAIGLRKSIGLLLEARFGSAGLGLMPGIDKVQDQATLSEFLKAIASAANVEQLGKLLR